jgi:hypothetical protein
MEDGLKDSRFRICGRSFVRAIKNPAILPNITPKRKRSKIPIVFLLKGNPAILIRILYLDCYIL